MELTDKEQRELNTIPIPYDEWKELKELKERQLGPLGKLVRNITLAGLIGTGLLRLTTEKIIPYMTLGKEVQSSNIAPSRLEFECSDADNNGKLETFLKVDGKRYAVQEINGNPTLVPYSTTKN